MGGKFVGVYCTGYVTYSVCVLQVWICIEEDEQDGADSGETIQVAVIGNREAGFRVGIS